MKYLVSMLLLVPVLFSNICFADDSLDANTRWGVGLGVRYAGIGASMEYDLGGQYSVYGGVGYVEDVSGTFGVNYYFKNKADRVNFRLTASYGFVAALTNENDEDDRFDESFNGASIGVGIVMDHFEFTITYRDISDFEDRKEELERMGFRVDDASELTFSLGYLF